MKRKLLAQEGILESPDGKPETGVDLRRFFK